jgi:O-antigen biosynthesis protein
MIVQERSEGHKIEIIVLCQNDLEVTKSFLYTLYDNTSDFSLIMIDNGSTDGSEAFLKEFVKNKHNMTLVRSEENLGCVNGRNHGIDVSTGLHPKPEYICFLDNDQFVGKGWLEQHLEVIKSGYDMVGVEAWVINASTLLPVRHNTDLSQTFSYVGCGGMLIRRDVIEVVGGFDPQFNPSYFEDPDYNFRMVEKGYKIGWNIKARIVHKQQKNSVTSTKKHQRFVQSYQRFQGKWRRKRVPIIKQSHIKAFEL